MTLILQLQLACGFGNSCAFALFDPAFVDLAVKTVRLAATTHWSLSFELLPRDGCHVAILKLVCILF